MAIAIISEAAYAVISLRSSLSGSPVVRSSIAASMRFSARFKIDGSSAML